jgi:O-antigen/teichoic acid export membrane protein
MGRCRRAAVRWKEVLPKSHLARSLLWVYCANGLNGVVGVFSVPIGLHYLGTEGYGLFSLYCLVVSYVSLADLGISKNLLALLSRHEDAEDRIGLLRTGLGLYCCLCLGWLVVMPALLWLVSNVLFPMPPIYRSTLRWLTVLAVSEFAIGVPQSLLQTACVARQEFGRYSRFTLLSGLWRNGVLIAGAVAFGSPLGLGAAMLARKLVDLFLAYRVMGGLPVRTWRPRFQIRNGLSMLGQSSTLSAAQMLYSSLMSIGSYLVNAHFGLYWLGLYRAAFDLAGKVSFIANGIGLVLFPKLAHLFARSEQRTAASALLRTALEASWALYAALGALGAILAPWALPKIGIRQAEAVVLFQLLVVALSLNCHTLVSNEIVQATGRYGNNILVGLSGLVVIVGVFSATAATSGPAAIGIAWIAAAGTSGLMADAVVLTYVGVAKGAQAASAIKKAALLLVPGAALACRPGPIGWAPAVVALLALAPILIRDIRKALRMVAERREMAVVVA